MTELEDTCNVCDEHCSTEREQFGRGTPSCRMCRSTVRMREVAYFARRALFGAGLPIPELRVRPQLRALDLSDWCEYGDRLAHHVDYRNTWYHEEPRLDITAVPDDEADAYDLVIATDVFEHVLPPVQRAFEGAARLLKPDGAFVFTGAG